MRFVPAFIAVLSFCVAVAAHAGSLFPPENLANPSAQCPNGQLLKWTGDSVICADPSPGVNVAMCPPGQVMAGIANGVPVCRKMSCRQVVGEGNIGPSYIASAACNADEVLTGGGAASETPGSNLCGGIGRSFLHASEPSGNGWVVDGYSYDYTADACTRAFAICCKFQ